MYIYQKRCEKRAVSSEQFLQLDLMLPGKSLMYTKNIREPRADVCGTTYFISS